MNLDEIKPLLSQDTQEYLQLIAGTPGLSLSHFRILSLLRAVSTSPRHIALATGMGVPRVRERLRQLEQKGYVAVIEILSDNSNVWGLVPKYRAIDTPVHPTEAFIAERRLKQVAVFTNEYDPQVTKTWGGPDGVVRPRNPVKADNIDIRSLKQYEAKVNK